MNGNDLRKLGMKYGVPKCGVLFYDENDPSKSDPVPTAAEIRAGIQAEKNRISLTIAAVKAGVKS